MSFLAALGIGSVATTSGAAEPMGEHAASHYGTGSRDPGAPRVRTARQGELRMELWLSRNLWTAVPLGLQSDLPVTPPNPRGRETNLRMLVPKQRRRAVMSLWSPKWPA